MRAVVKNTCCPLCASELVVANGIVNCLDGCHLGSGDWHPDTAAKLAPVIEWSQGVTGTSPASVDKGQN